MNQPVWTIGDELPASLVQNGLPDIDGRAWTAELELPVTDCWTSTIEDRLPDMDYQTWTSGHELPDTDLQT